MPTSTNISLNHISEKRIFSDKSVCVVGSNSSILGKYLGDIIDDHDIVIRINHGANLQNAPQDVGRKFDIWVYGAMAVVEGASNEQISSLQDSLRSISRIWHAGWYGGSNPNAERIKGFLAQSSRVCPSVTEKELILSPTQHADLCKQSKMPTDNKPTSGLCTVWRALLEGPSKVNIAGFGGLKDSILTKPQISHTPLPAHIQDNYNKYRGRTPCHNYYIENSFLRRLSEEEYIHILDIENNQDSPVTLLASHPYWSGVLHLYVDGTFCRPGIDSGEYKWVKEKHLILNWHRWPPEKLIWSHKKKLYLDQSKRFTLKEV